MPTRPVDRLLFVQGGLCFFCKQPLPRDDASVEHLQAIANGGANGDDNCVACCKTMNALLGSMSIKQKFEVVLNQKGHFKCPNITVTAAPKQVVTSTSAALAPPRSVTPKPVATPAPNKADRYAMVVANPKNARQFTATDTEDADEHCRGAVSEGHFASRGRGYRSPSVGDRQG